MSELADVTEQLRSEREECNQQIRSLEQRLVEMSSKMASNSVVAGPSSGASSAELSDAKKQIRLLEQTILELSERSATNTNTSAGGAEKGKVELLQRQLAQVEFEKQQIETTLKQERQQKSARRPSSSSNNTAASQSSRAQNGTMTAAAPPNERASMIKAELETLRPAVPKLMDRLTSLFSALQTKPNTSSTPLNLDAVNRAYTDIKHSFEGLEASRKKALSSIQRAGGQVNVAAPNGDVTMMMQSERHVERTPTMNRLSFGSHPPL